MPKVPMPPKELPLVAKSARAQTVSPEPVTLATVAEKLDRMLHYMERMDRRDRWRSWSIFLRNILGIIPLAIFLGSLWYFYEHGEDILKKITEEAAKQAAIYTQNDFVKEFQNIFVKPTSR